jgi:hypothetical protein
MSQCTIILGNGFDLDLGLKTRFSDFAKSDYWQKPDKKDWLKFFLFPLSIFLNKRKDNEYWFDLEGALREYALRYGTKYNAESSLKYYERIGKSICEYIKQEQKNAKIRKESMAYDFIKAVQTCKSFHIYSFNYTDFHSIPNMPGLLDYDNVFTHIHGSVNANNIILGIDELDGLKEDSYKKMYKVWRDDYKGFNSKSLEKSSEIIFYGFSFSDIDYPYFKTFFEKVANGELEYKHITIFTKDKDSSFQIMNKLDKENVKISALKDSYKNFNIITTDNINSAEYKEVKKNLSIIRPALPPVL